MRGKSIHRTDLNKEPEKFSSAKAPIVWIDTLWPFDGADAGSTRTLAILKLLSQEGHKVVFVYLGLGFKPATAPSVELVFSLPEASKRLSLSNYPDPYVWFSRVQSAVLWWTLASRYFSQSRTIFDTVDLTFRRLESIAKSQRSGIIFKLAENFRSIESHFAQVSSKTLVVSDLERAELIALTKASVQVIPTIHAPRPIPDSRTKSRGLVFIGNFAHFPNGEGLEWFLNEVWPLLSPRVKSEGLTILGKGANKFAIRHSGTNIWFKGWVENAAEEIIGARVSIAPLLSGAGVKGKISQSMSLGTPVVTTSIGAEGMGLADGRTALIADTSQQFANAIEKLFSDPDLAKNMSRNSIEFAELCFGTGRAKQELDKLMQELRDE